MKKSFAELESNVLTFITRRSKSAPALREDMKDNLQCNDRIIRKAISSLQEKGWQIVSMGKGYYISETDEVKAYMVREAKRAFKILSKVRHMEKNIMNISEQLSLFLKEQES